MWSLKLNYSESCRLACWYSLYSMFIDAHNVFDILSICQPTIHSHNFLIYRLLYIYFLQIDSVGRRFRMIHDFVWEEMSLKKLKFLLFCLIYIYYTCTSCWQIYKYLSFRTTTTNGRWWNQKYSPPWWTFSPVACQSSPKMCPTTMQVSPPVAERIFKANIHSLWIVGGGSGSA